MAVTVMSSPSPSPSSAESSFRELDDAFLQNQTRIWVGEVLQIRFDEEMNISDLLADGNLLFEVSEVLLRMFPTPGAESPLLRTNESKSLISGKSTMRYMPYYNVGSFLRMCKNLGLNGIDLFSPSDVVEKRNIRKVCMCIRSLSKKVRSRDLNVPDFDSVTCTLAMPTDMVEGIRKSLEKSQCSSSLSVGHESEKISRVRYWQRMSNSDSAVSNGDASHYCDDADSGITISQSEGHTNHTCIPSPDISSLELQLNTRGLEHEENEPSEYMSPSPQESVGSPCSQYYSDQELNSPPSSTCLASRISGINDKGKHKSENSDANHVRIDWGDISLDDGYRDDNENNGEIGYVIHDEHGKRREKKSCNVCSENFSLDIECEKNSYDSMKHVNCINSVSVGGSDLDVGDECAILDFYAGKAPLSNLEKPEKEQTEHDATKHGMVTCELSFDDDKTYTDMMVKDELSNELLPTPPRVSSPTENPDYSTIDGNNVSLKSAEAICAEEDLWCDNLCNANTPSENMLSEVMFQVEQCPVIDSHVHGSNCPNSVAVKLNGNDDHWIYPRSVAESQASILVLPCGDGKDTIVDADIHRSPSKNVNGAFDVDKLTSYHAEICKDDDFTSRNVSNSIDIPDMDLSSSTCKVIANDNRKYPEQKSVDNQEGFVDHSMPAANINGTLNIEDITFRNNFTTTLCSPRPGTERQENVEDSDNKPHQCAENTESESEDYGTDKKMPQSKPQRTLLKSVVKGVALVGVAVFLLHIRKNTGAPLPKMKKQPVEVRKKSTPKPSSQKSENNRN